MDANTVQILTQVLAFIASTVAILMVLRKKSGGSKIPEVKGGYPFLGQVFEMTKGSPWDTMAKWCKQYGATYRFVLFGSDCVSIADPAQLKMVLHSKLSLFLKDVEFTYKPFMVLLGRGIVTSEGSEWRRQRTHLSSALRIDILEFIPEMAINAVHRLCVKLDAAKASGEPVEMAEEFRHLTLQVIAEAVLSLSPEESDATFAKMYLPIVTEGNVRTWHPYRAFLPTPAWFKFNADVKKLNDYVSGIIRRRWAVKMQEEKDGVTAGVKVGTAAGQRKRDLLDKLLEAYNEGSWSEDAVEQVRDEIKTFILAGHETSASMLSWSLYELVTGSSSNTSGRKGKSHMETIVEESRRVFEEYRSAEKNSSDSSNSHSSEGRILHSVPKRAVCDQLIFAECCLRESLRKYSPVPTVVRMPAGDVSFEGSADGKVAPFTVSRGTTVFVNIMGVHHNPEYWPEPSLYNPERFMGGMDSIRPYTFIPFIEGPRMCMGQFLALLESKVVLSLLCSKYKFTVVNADAGETHAFMVPIIPKTGHFMKIS